MNKAPNFCLRADKRKDGIFMGNQNQEKKPNIFKRVKNWWDGLTADQQWLCVTGLWTVDGLLWGSYLTARHYDKKMTKVEQVGACKGYVLGQIDAYKEMAQNPYAMMDAGMKRLEQQGIAKKF